MEKVQIYGHTIGTIYNKEFFSATKLEKQKEVKCRKTRGIKRLGLEARPRQVKLEFTRTHILINAYHRHDFDFKKILGKDSICYRDIDHVEIREIGNNNKEDFSRTFKIKFFNELNEEIFYLNFGNNDEFYSYYDAMRGYAILVAHLNCNNIEYELIDETYFR